MDVQPPAIGTLLGHYRILDQIGHGGMGVVFRARDERLEREVAVKILPPGTFPNENARKRFRREAHVLAKLNHPNVAMAFDYSHQDGIDYLVTEYVGGIALDARLASGALPQKTVIHLGIQLAKGLAAAHREQIIHYRQWCVALFGDCVPHEGMQIESLRQIEPVGQSNRACNGSTGWKTSVNAGEAVGVIREV